MPHKDTVTIINMTPHKVCLYDVTGQNILKEYPSSGTVRLGTIKEQIHVHPLSNEVPTYTISRTKESAAVPEYKAGVYFIVSALVQDAYPERKDFIAPNTSQDTVGAVRNSQGEIIGVKSFIVNP